VVEEASMFKEGDLQNVDFPFLFFFVNLKINRNLSKEFSFFFL